MVYPTSSTSLEKVMPESAWTYLNYEEKSGGSQSKSIFMLDNPQEFHYNIQAIGVWRSLVSRLVRVQEASGSNPDTPTISSVHNGFELWTLDFL